MRGFASGKTAHTSQKTIIEMTSKVSLPRQSNLLETSLRIFIKRRFYLCLSV
jgi:hypothetical protein